MLLNYFSCNNIKSFLFEHYSDVPFRILKYIFCNPLQILSIYDVDYDFPDFTNNDMTFVFALPCLSKQKI